MCEPFKLQNALYIPQTSGWLSTKKMKHFFEQLPENQTPKENCWWLDNPTFNDDDDDDEDDDYNTHKNKDAANDKKTKKHEEEETTVIQFEVQTNIFNQTIKKTFKKAGA